MIKILKSLEWMQHFQKVIWIKKESKGNMDETKIQCPFKGINN